MTITRFVRYFSELLGQAAPAQLGNGTASASTFLRGDSTWAAPAIQRDQFRVYQDFTWLPDGALPNLMTGQTWIQNTIGTDPHASAVVSGGRMVTATPGASSYPTADLGPGQKPDMVWATFTFGAAGTSGSSIVLIVSAVSPINLDHIMGLIHLVVTEAAWNLGFYDAGAYTVVASGSHGLPIPCDGTTIASAGMQLAGNTATLYLPDGTTRVVTDARVGAMNGRYVTFESYQPVGSHQPGYTIAAALARLPAVMPYAYTALDGAWRVAGQRASLGANTFTNTQTVNNPTGGIVIQQDGTRAWRLMLGNNNLLYMQSTVDNWTGAYTTFVVDCGNGMMNYSAGVYFATSGFQFKNPGGAPDAGMAWAAAGVLKITGGAAGGALATGSSVTGSRPSVSTVGAQWYDTTLGRPIWWSGSNWRDAAGNVV